MSSQQEFLVPTERELLEWFGCPPKGGSDSRYAFEVVDSVNVKLRFSFDVIQSSVQTTIFINDVPVTKVVHENARKLWLQDIGGRKTLRAEFATKEEVTQLVIEIEPRIRVEWSSLFQYE